jgi:hypothetical protein
MGVQTDSAILFAVCFSLVASSFCCSWIINDYTNSPLCLQGQACGPIVLNYQPIPKGVTITGQDFTNASGYDQNLTWPAGAGVLGNYGTWQQQEGTGMVLTGSSGLLQDTPMIVIDDLTGNNGVYTVNYLIDNSPGGDFIITPRYMGAGHTVSDIRITFKQDGIHIAKYPDYFILPSDLYYENVPNVEATQAGGSLYSTVLDTNLNTLTISKDGNIIYQGGNMPSLDPDTAMSQTGVYYGGVGSNNVGFTIKGFPDTGFNAIDPADEVSFGIGNYWTGFIGWLDKVIPGAGAVYQMVSTMGAIIVWTLPESMFPLWLNVLLIKTQVIIILYLLAKLIRGGG